MTCPTIRVAIGDVDYAGFGVLCRAYVDWCRSRYAADPAFVERVFGWQSLDDELAGLARKYGPPNGHTIIVELDGQIIAGGAYRRLDEGVCELKRLFVGDAGRGHGLGKRLTQALIDAAVADGYVTMRLDTGGLMTEAVALYEAMGFHRIAPYHSYPTDISARLIFMEKTIAASSPAAIG